MTTRPKVIRAFQITCGICEWETCHHYGEGGLKEAWKEWRHHREDVHGDR